MIRVHISSNEFSGFHKCFKDKRSIKSQEFVIYSDICCLQYVCMELKGESKRFSTQGLFSHPTTASGLIRGNGYSSTYPPTISLFFLLKYSTSDQTPVYAYSVGVNLY